MEHPPLAPMAAASDGGAQASPPLRRPSHLALAVAATVALWDFLFFEEVVGFTAGLFTLAATALLVWAHPGKLRRLLPCGIVAGLVAVAASQCVEPTQLALLLRWLGLVSLRLATQAPDGLRGAQWLVHWLGVPMRSWFAWAADFAVLRAHLADRDHWRGRLGCWLGNWLLPTALALPFLVLFAMANPLVEVKLHHLFEALGELLRSLFPLRLSLWAFMFALLWALLRFDANREVAVHREVAAPAGRAIAVSRQALRDAMLVRCLLVFNLLFGVQTTLDAGYLWSGFALPDGMTYAEYAHRGAYPLVATTLLAIVFILTAFHDRAGEDGDTGRHRLAARLVYLWLAQNAFLLASAAARLDLYIEVYQMTYFRIASAIWMLLIAVGLALTTFKIASGRTNAWLIDANLAVTAVVLVFCCFPNFDRWIAEYNVEQALTLERRLDVHYLATLGPDALPALRLYWDEMWVYDSPDWDPLRQAIGCVNRDQLRRLQESGVNWRGATLRRRALRARLDTSWGAYLPACPDP